MKYILVIGDGMEDEPQAALQGKTPLEAALTPTLDFLSPQSMVGSVITGPAGTAPGSDRAILELLGLWQENAPGRSALEAAGNGISFNSEDFLCRCNLVTLSNESIFERKRLLSHNGGGIGREEADALGKFLLDTPSFRLLAEKAGVSLRLGHSFRHLAVLKQDIRNVPFTPPHEMPGEPVGDYSRHLPENIKALLILVNRLLDGHPINHSRQSRGLPPANGLWLWSPGRGGTLPDFRQKYGLGGAVVCGTPLVRGIGAACGMAAPVVQGATGDIYTDYNAKAAAALRLLRSYDFVLIHVEAPDEATHQGDLMAKVRSISSLDRAILGPVVSGIQEPFRLLVLSDHRSYIRTRAHGIGPVSFLLYDSTRPSSGPLHFSEHVLGQAAPIPASGLMPMFLGKKAAFY